MNSKVDAATAAANTVDSLDWDEIYRALLPRVYRYFCYRVGEGQLAEDLTSATFEKAWRGRNRYRRNLSAFSTWIFTIAGNVAIDSFRTAKAEHPVDPDRLPDNRELLPETSLLAKDDGRRLTTLLQSLPGRDRELLALRYGADLSYAKIAKVTNLTATNVGVILHRAVKQLREAWEETDE